MPSTSTLTEETRRWQKAVSVDSSGTVSIAVTAVDSDSTGSFIVALGTAFAGRNDLATTGTSYMKIGGLASPTGTRVAVGDDVFLRLNQFGGITPERQNVLIGTITSSTATSGAQVGSATNIGQYKFAQVVISLNGATGDTNSSTFFVDSRLDGTTWLNIAASPVMATVTSTATVHVIQLTKNIATPMTTAITADAGPGTVRNVAFADDLRVRYTVTGDTAAVSFRIWVNLIG